MPARTPDVGVQRFELRPGQEFKRLRGVNRSADPASIPDDQFHLLTNVRLTPAGMVDRPGLVPHHAAAETGCITGMIEIDESGIGLLVSPSQQQATQTPKAARQLVLGGTNWLWIDYYAEPLDTPFETTSPTYPETVHLGLLNEEKVGTVDYGPYPGSRSDQRADFRRYNIISEDPPNSTDDTVLYAGSKSGSSISWAGYAGLLRYRKRILQFGTRTRPAADDEDTDEPVICLWEIKLPTRDDEIVAGYQLYADLWPITGDESYPVDAVTLFGRDDDPLTGEERIREIMYISSREGKVYSFDGTTLREDYSAGGNYALRLAVLNGQSIFAIGSNWFPDEDTNPPTATVAAQLPFPGGTWSSVTVSELLRVSDLIPYNGAIYITSVVPTGNPGSWTGARIYKWSGAATLAAHIYQFTYAVGLPVLNPPSAADKLGLLFVRRGNLYAIWLGANASGEYKVVRRLTDTNWTTLSGNINAQQDNGASVDWLTVSGERVFIGGYYHESSPTSNPKHIISEITGFTSSVGASHLYYNLTPLEPGPEVGYQAIVVSPEDTVLNDEEL